MSEAQETESFTDTELEKVFDAFAARSDPHEVARKTGLSVTRVKEIIEDPHAARRALRRKLGIVGAWFAGSILDTLRQIIQEGSPQHQLSAIKTLRDIVTSESMATLPATQPLALPGAELDGEDEEKEVEELPPTLEQVVHDAEYVVAD